MHKLQTKPQPPHMWSVPSPKREPLLPRFQRKLIVSFGILALLFSFIIGIAVWSCMNHLEESVPGIGEIVPTGRLRKVRAPASGRVVQFRVKENQRVKAGELLVVLDPEYVEAERSGYTEQIGYMQDQINALEAAYKGKSGNISNSDFGQVQNAWLAATQRATEAKMASAQMQIDKSEHLYYESLEHLKKTQILLATDQTMLAKYQSLYDKGGLPLKDLEAYKQQVVNREGELRALEQEVEARKLDWEQAKQQPVTITGEYDRELLGNMTTIKRSMGELKTNIGKVDVIKGQQVVRAPIDGVIHELAVTGVGEYVTTGEPLLNIVPDDAEMLAEVKVTNRDLAYIHLDQKAILQIDAFPYQQFGKLEGVIESISPSTMKSPEGLPYYLVQIRPERKMFSKNGRKYSLRSGMTLQAQIITRDKNIISFFSEPVTQHLEKAFRDPSKY